MVWCTVLYCVFVWYGVGTVLYCVFVWCTVLLYGMVYGVVWIPAILLIPPPGRDQPGIANAGSTALWKLYIYKNTNTQIHNTCTKGLQIQLGSGCLLIHIVLLSLCVVLCLPAAEQSWTQASRAQASRAELDRSKLILAKSQNIFVTGN